MTSDEAIERLESGGRVTHRYFTSGEWVKLTGRKYEFEDGCLCDIDEFWAVRSSGGWSAGWREC